MRGIYKVEKDKVEQYAFATYSGKAKVLGGIFLVIIFSCVFQADKDSWTTILSLLIMFAFLMIIMIIAFLFGTPPALDTTIEIKEDRIINTRYGSQIEIEYGSLGRFIRKDIGLLVLRKGLEGEIDYFFLRKLYSNKTVVFIPCAIEKYKEICDFLESQKR